MRRGLQTTEAERRQIVAATAADFLLHDRVRKNAQLAQFVAWRAALRLEIARLRRHPGQRSTYSLIREAMGWKGSRGEFLRRLNIRINEMLDSNATSTTTSSGG